MSALNFFSQTDESGHPDEEEPQNPFITVSFEDAPAYESDQNASFLDLDHQNNRTESEQTNGNVFFAQHRSWNVNNYYEDDYVCQYPCAVVESQIYDYDCKDEFEDINSSFEDALMLDCDVEIDDGYDSPEVHSPPYISNLPTVVDDLCPDTNSDSGCDSPPECGTTLKKKRKRSKVKRLWEFLAEALSNEQYSPRYLDWVDKSKGIFKFVHSKKVAEAWGHAKNKPKMPYEHLSRALRHYYSLDILHRIPNRRLVYQFGPNATDWRRLAKLTIQ